MGGPFWQVRGQNFTYAFAGLRYICGERSAVDTVSVCRQWRSLDCSEGLTRACVCEGASVSLILPMLINAGTYIKLLVGTIQRHKGIRDTGLNKLYIILSASGGGLMMLISAV